jgi:hypothetical protein
VISPGFTEDIFMSRRTQVCCLLQALALSTSLPLAGSIDLSWTPCDAPGLAGYRVHLGTSPGRYERILTAAGPEIRLDGLADETLQYIRVEAFGREGRKRTETLALSAELKSLPAPVVHSVGPLMPSEGGAWRTVIAGSNLSPQAVVRLRSRSLAIRSVVPGENRSLIVEVMPVAVPGEVGLPLLDARSVLVVNPTLRRPAFFDADPLRADVDGDGRIGEADLELIRAEQGLPAAGTDPARAADLNGDGIVDGTDLAYFSRVLTAERGPAIP